MKISVDPGLTGFGYAIWKNDPDLPEDVGNISSTDPKDFWLVRAKEMLDDFKLVLNMNSDITDLYIEEPTYMSAGKGLVAAESNSLLKLNFMFSCAVYMCQERSIRIHLIPVIKWKGQLTKDLTMARLKRRMPKFTASLKKDYPDHVWDAIGIGRYGIFGKNLAG